MTATIAEHIMALPPLVALVAVFALPALESSAFVGFIFPGEIALILGGVLAYQGKVSLVAVLVAAICGAVVGDSVGYAVGTRYGRRLLDGTVGRLVNGRHLDRAETYLRERGGRAVFLGRFTATLRVLVPGLAGMSGLRYRTFLIFNVASAVGWGTLSVMLGYLGGSSWRHVEHIVSRVGLLALTVVAVVMVAGVVVRRAGRRSHLRGTATIPASAGSTTDASGHERPRRALVVLPTYNEAGNITTALYRVLAAAPGIDVLVVDDRSPDDTAGRVRRHPAYIDAVAVPAQTPGQVHLLSRPAREGLGAAYRAGFAWALGGDYDAVVQMDADLSHPADRIPALLKALDAADMSVGSRYVAGGAVGDWPMSRRLISRAGNAYVRLVLGLPIQDSTSGFKAFTADALQRISVLSSTSNGYCFQVENTWRAIRLGLVVTEVPITFTDRAVGNSKMSQAIVIEALSRVAWWRLRELGAPIRLIGPPGKAKRRRVAV
jgi:dolichol-phosphate mannosyltransferase